MLTEKKDYFEEICEMFPLDHSRETKTADVKAKGPSKMDPSTRKAFSTVQIAVLARILEVILGVSTMAVTFVLAVAGTLWALPAFFVGLVLTLLVEEIHQDMIDSANNHINR